jgi:hypothetical protein
MNNTKKELKFKDVYLMSEIVALDQFMGSSRVEIVKHLKLHGVNKIDLKPPYNNQFVYLKSEIDSFISEQNI